MQDRIKCIVLETMQASEAVELEVIQTLWSGYGKIIRVGLDGIVDKTVILKNVIPPTKRNHPRGWNTDFSNERKLKSYQVEMEWYQHWSSRCNSRCKIPKCYAAETIDGEQLIILEDLDSSGYPIRKSSLDKNEVKVCIDWLAHFHAKFLGEDRIGLWEQGTYWHLATRPDELKVMENGALKDKAQQIDELLNSCKYKTIVHGDAKVTNFCFSEDLLKVAAVDFQYVGGGCGMKDLVYLLGSCLDESLCEMHEEELINCYFLKLKEAIKEQNKKVDWIALEKEWRSMYAIAWTDFSRFLMGWMPTHRKLNSYTKRLEKETLIQLKGG